ncbi:MAG: FxsA family protein, partial [Pseudolabrys sp.]
MRVVMKQGSLTALRADGSGGVLLLAGILLLIPGFISDLLAFFLLVVPVGRAAGAAFGERTAHDDGVVDLAPEQWHQVPDPSLPD